MLSLSFTLDLEYITQDTFEYAFISDSEVLKNYELLEIRRSEFCKFHAVFCFAEIYKFSDAIVIFAQHFRSAVLSKF